MEGTHSPAGEGEFKFGRQEKKPIALCLLCSFSGRYSFRSFWFSSHSGFPVVPAIPMVVRSTTNKRNVRKVKSARNGRALFVVKAKPLNGSGLQKRKYVILQKNGMSKRQINLANCRQDRHCTYTILMHPSLLFPHYPKPF